MVKLDEELPPPAYDSLFESRIHRNLSDVFIINTTLNDSISNETNQNIGNTQHNDSIQMSEFLVQK